MKCFRLRFVDPKFPISNLLVNIVLLLLVSKSVRVNCQEGDYADYYGAGGGDPADYYNDKEKSDFPMYDFPPVTSYANELAAEIKPQEAASGQIRDYEYPDTYNQYDNYNYDLNDNFEFSEQANFSNPPKKIQQKSSIEITNLDEKLPYKIPEFPSPFPNVLHVFEHPLEGIKHGMDTDDGFSITQFGNYGDFTEEVAFVVVFFLGLYVLFTVLFKDGDKLFQPKCEQWGWDGFPEHEFHAEARFVPVVPRDEYLQRDILELFHGVQRRSNNGGGGSSEEGSMDAYGQQLSFITEMCPRDAFFFGMAPNHILAYRELQRMFVAQDSPKDVYHLAKEILYSKRINPKLFYLGIIASSIERTDMNGFAIAHPIDAMPDLFIPAILIDEDEKWRSDHFMRSGSKMYDRHIRPYGKGNNSYVIRPKTKSKKPKKSRFTREISNVTLTLDLNVNLNETKGEIEAEVKPKPKVDIDVKNKNPNRIGDILSEVIDIDKRQGYGWGEKPRYKVYPKQKKNKKGNDGWGWDGKNNNNKKKKGNKKGKGKNKKDCIVVDGRVGEDNGIENKLWYWREDMMLNQHHFYWHQLYPVNATRHGDRRAELFFYMHRSMLARYNAERLSNGFERTRIMQVGYGTVLEEGYNSHLADFNAGQYWTPRAPFTTFTDTFHIHDPNFSLDILIKDFLGLYGRFKKAVKSGKLISAKGKNIPLTNKKGTGIHPLGNTIEASELSVNPMYYDAFGFHNTGHYLVALMSDPEYHKRIPAGVMAEAATSMRDPAFYTFHAIIDDIFEKYKQTLPPYQITGGVYPLLWNGVEIIDVEIKSQHGVNELKTFYSQHKFPLPSGVDGSVYKGEKKDVCATHLDHEPFQFKIVIDRKPCAKSKSGIATVRLIMAPRFDEHGKRLPLVQQRRLMFPLDTFQFKLKVGRNTITRRDIDSSLTVPWSKSLKEMKKGFPDLKGAADYCGCGWPRHLYIPKGMHEGMAFDLFVMVTNYDNDFVADDPADLEIPETCNSPYIFCGIPRRRYPDSKPMGYPFDRPPYKVPKSKCSGILCKFLPGSGVPVATLEDYVAPVSNMASITFGIKHVDKLIHKHKGYKGR